MARRASGSPTPLGKPSAEELESVLDPRRQMYGIQEDEALGALRAMQDPRAKYGNKFSPLASLPVAAGVGEFNDEAFEAIAIYNDLDEEDLSETYGADWVDLDQYNDITAGTYYQGQVVYNNLASDYVDVYSNMRARPVMPGDRSDTSPAPISLVPTSTTNVNRPRTVAAGYDSRRQVLTVVFRDGTFYNYYEVPSSEWRAFKTRKSKGKFIRDYLDAYDRGVADVAAMPTAHRETLYRISRTSQMVYSKGRKSGQIDRKGSWASHPQTHTRLRKKTRF